MPPVLKPPIAFAHRGARAHAPENTLAAFDLALRLGVTGLESDVWVTEDGVAVLDHDGIVKKMLRRRRICELDRHQLPSHVPSLEDLFDACGHDFELSLDLKDPGALAAVLDVVRRKGEPGRLWLCHPDWRYLAAQRGTAHDIKLVDSTRLKRLGDGPERHAARVAEAGIDAVNMHHSDWNLGLTTLFHRFGLTLFGWDAQFERVLRALVEMEIDGVYSDDSQLMMNVIGVPGSR